MAKKATKAAEAKLESKPTDKTETTKNEAKPIRTKPATKTAEAKPEPQNKKQRNKFGHSENTQSWVIDSLLLRGATVDDLARQAKTSRGRVRSHIRHLEQNHGQKIVEKDGVFKLETPKKGGAK